MNFKQLSSHFGEKGLWSKALQDFSEKEIVALVKLIGGQAVNRLLCLIDIAGRPNLENLKEYWNRFGSEIESSIYNEELITAIAAKAQEFESIQETETTATQRSMNDAPRSGSCGQDKLWNRPVFDQGDPS